MIKKIFSVVLSVSILICSGVQVAKADTVDWQDGQGYEYPVTPVDKEWGEFSSHQEMLDHCQLPEECVKAMTTEQLFDTVLKYPLLIDIFFMMMSCRGFLKWQSSFLWYICSKFH